ncbi:hypothetical protein [Maricaulis sp.]|uniref:hypothetical protein n=1 Tax=Maricaulis sp. TaxID=1486257 RepID=UPI0026318306|nr:hypothetical protein [Maricaulis sp.]
MASPNAWIAGLAGALALGGCATSGLQMPGVATAPVAEPVAADAVEALSELPAQPLVAGACGTFFWSADSSHRFLAFENETEGFARVFANGQVNAFSFPARQSSFIVGDPYERRYVDAGRQLDLRLTGTVGERLPEGQRIERSVLSIQQPDGQRLVIPVIGHYACRQLRPG